MAAESALPTAAIPRLLAGVLVSVLLSALVPGCGAPAGETGSAAAGEKRRDPLRERSSEEIALGLSVYTRYCAGCHGARGDGKGPAARFLFPPPRDFTMGIYKFTTTPAKSLPTDDDLMRTITYGLRGTAMPSFRLLTDAERRAVIGTLKGFYPDWDTYPPVSPVTRYANPFDLDPERPQERQKAIELGEELYHGRTMCWNCHPMYVKGERLAEISRKYGKPLGRPNPDQPVLKPDEWGHEIPPPDFRTSKLKSVRTLDDLYRVIAAGVGGTAMPTWVESLDARELWALTLYVDSLIQEGRQARRQRLAAAVRR